MVVRGQTNGLGTISAWHGLKFLLVCEEAIQSPAAKTQNASRQVELPLPAVRGPPIPLCFRHRGGLQAFPGPHGAGGCCSTEGSAAAHLLPLGGAALLALRPLLAGPRRCPRRRLLLPTCATRQKAKLCACY